MSNRSPADQVLLDGDITASWLTALLRDHGHLERGEVSQVSVKPWRAKKLSDLLRLRATYAEDVDLPERFVLKRSRSVPSSSIARRRHWKEHEFYTQLVPLMARSPAPRHFAASLSSDRRHSLLLLEDLSLSHTRPPSPLPSDAATLLGHIDCLACLHAAWWQHADLLQATLTRDEAWIANRTASARRLIARFQAEADDRLAPAGRQALDQVAAAWPQILRRSMASSLTVVHGDAHPWNFLTPRDPGHDRTRLLDWEAWAIEPGAYDLASLLALHVPSAARPAQEAALLTRYVDQLRRAGVANYDLTACRDDYRWAVARKMIAPASMWSRGSQRRAWQPMLERISAAYDDLRCAALFAC